MEIIWTSWELATWSLEKLLLQLHELHQTSDKAILQG